MLKLDFQGPTAGRLWVVVECAPRRPLTRHPVLRFPRVVFSGVTGTTEAVYGLRTTGIEKGDVGRGGMIDFAVGALRDFAPVLDLTNPVRTLPPTPGGVTELRPSLQVGEPPAVRTVTAWQVGPHRADASGTMSWIAKEPLTFIEFAVPKTTVLEVRGTQVAGWNHAGGRVQVWLRTGAKKGSIEWVGTSTPVPPGKPLPNPVTFDATHPKVTSAQVTSDVVRVRATDGWSVRVDRARGWQLSPAPKELRFRTELPNAQHLRLQLVPRS